MSLSLQQVEEMAAQLPAEDKLKLIEHLAHSLATNDRPEPARYFKGRPVYTKEQLAKMDNTLPDESAWVAEIEKRAQERK
jgi:hypothetical protein